MAKILVVDDQPAGREYLVSLLGYKGHSMFEAADGVEALEGVHACRPDLVIADVLMPTMDGFELVRRIRSDATIARTPVIFCTAHYHEREAAALAKSCGVARVLTKPCDPEIVLEAVGAVLGHVAPATAPDIPEQFDRMHLDLVTDKLSNTMEGLRTANERLTELINICMRLTSERDPDRLLQSVCDSARRLIGARYAILGVVDNESGRFQHFHTSGMDQQLVGRISVPSPRKGALAAVLDERRTYRANRLNGDAVKVGLPGEHPTFHSVLAAPIASNSHSYGLLCLTEKLGFTDFSEEEEQLMAILAAQVGRIYENGSMVVDLRRHATDLEREMRERRLLQDSQSRLSAILEATSDFVGMSDARGRVTYINRAGRDMIGLDANADISHLKISDVHPEWAHHIILNRGIPIAIRDGIWSGDSAVEGLNDEEIPVSQVIIAHKDADDAVEYLSTIMRDTSEQKKAEDMLRKTHETLLHAGKMEAMGRMAGGLAHDFNNLLTVITGYSEILLASTPDPSARQLVEEVKHAGDRAATLTRQLLAFSRKQVMQVVTMDVNEAIHSLEKMLRRVIREDIKLHVRTGDTNARIKADPHQFEQILLNLALNARDAMPDGGSLTIVTEQFSAPSTLESALDAIPPGDYVAVRVTDTGCGMDEHVRAHLFEPFFTTKEPGKGTGLGLASVYGIARQSSAYILVDSEVGKGTTFSVLFPAVHSRVSAALPVAPNMSGMPGGHETVLLVEDETAVRSLAKRILVMQGYNVLEAADGAAALHVSNTYQGKIDLLISDIVMPNMSGPDLAHQLAARRPDTKVLYISGYAESMALKKLRRDKFSYLAKPFTPNIFAERVRDALDGNHAHMAGP